MLRIRGITTDAKQKHTLILPNGLTVILRLEYKPQQYGWFLGLEYAGFALTSFRVVSSPNMLRQFQHLFPYGLGCFVTENQEPLLQTDFETSRAKLYILTGDEVSEFEDLLGE